MQFTLFLIMMEFGKRRLCIYIHTYYYYIPTYYIKNRVRIRLATISQRQRQPLNTYTPTYTRTHRQADTAMYNPEIKHIKIKILSGGSRKERKRDGGG